MSRALQTPIFFDAAVLLLGIYPKEIIQDGEADAGSGCELSSGAKEACQDWSLLTGSKAAHGLKTPATGHTLPSQAPRALPAPESVNGGQGSMWDGDPRHGTCSPPPRPLEHTPTDLALPSTPGLTPGGQAAPSMGLGRE